MTEKLMPGDRVEREAILTTGANWFSCLDGAAVCVQFRLSGDNLSPVYAIPLEAVDGVVASLQASAEQCRKHKENPNGQG